MFLVIKKDSIWIDSDERSKTNPGYGYPAHSLAVDRVFEFQNFEAVQKYLEGESKYYNFDLKQYRVFQGEFLGVSRKINFEIK